MFKGLIKKPADSFELKGALFALIVVGVSIITILYVEKGVAFVFIGIGCMCLLYSLHKLRDGMESNQWPAVAGIVDYSGIDSFRDGAPYTGSFPMYFPNITFSYSIQGEKYTSSRISIDPKDYEMSDEAEVRKIVEGFRAGAAQEVYVNPRNPKYAVIFKGMSKGRKHHYQVLLIVGVLLCLVGGVYFGFNA